MNEHQLLDRRIQRTRQLLQEALFHLIIDRPYDSVTIQDITEQANLGRTTFYLHYRDKEDLLRESIKALLHDLQCDVEPDTGEACTYHISSVRIFQHVAQRQQLYRAMLKETGSTINLGDLMRGYFTELFHQASLQEPQKRRCSSFASSEIFAAHAAGSLFGLLSWWLDHGVSPSPEQMGMIYHRLMTHESEDLP